MAEAGYRVVNLLHETIDHPNIVNLRRFTPDQRLDTTTDEATATRIAVVGADPAAPTLTTTLTLTRALVEAGWAANLAPTSGPGIVAAGFGRCLDAVPPVHTAGVLQAVIHTVEAEAEVVVVEGQGALDDPANAPLAATISHTTRSRYHILCHRPPPPNPPPTSAGTAEGGDPGGDSDKAEESGDTPDAASELATTLTEAAARTRPSTGPADSAPPCWEWPSTPADSNRSMPSPARRRPQPGGAGCRRPGGPLASGGRLRGPDR